MKLLNHKFSDAEAVANLQVRGCLTYSDVFPAGHCFFDSPLSYPLLYYFV